MKQRNTVVALLVAGVVVSGLLSVVFAFVYSFGTRDLRRIQPQVATVNARLNIAQALLNDAIEYSKRNPDLDPILHSLKLKPVEAGGSTNRAATP
jgi:hypothetical protein